MRLRFIGKNGSMGLTFGRIYRLKIEPWKNGVRAVSGGISCPYESDKAFWENWATPDTDIRDVMERNGRRLRDVHISKG